MKKPTVTLISGLPGSGKTSLLNHLLKNLSDRKVGVIFNSRDLPDRQDSSEEVDFKLLSEQPLDSFIELTDGCICCSLQEEFLGEVWQLSQQGVHDCLLIEADGVAEPASVAAVFLYVDENGDSLSNVATLDTLVTVVNAETFLEDFNSTAELGESGIALDEDDNRDLVRLLVDQIEAANVVVLNKSDRVSSEDRQFIVNLLRHLNPEASVIVTERGNIRADEVINTGRFSEIGRQTDVSTNHDTSDSGLSRFYFQAARPFHPQRLWNFWMEHELAPTILRSRGSLWLATRNDMSGFWTQAGQVMAAEPAGRWWAATDREQWPEDDPEFVNEIESGWDEQWGDRRQDLLMIAQGDVSGITDAMSQCLLTDAEMQEGPDSWDLFDDPFAPWETCAHDHDHDHDCSRDHDHG